MGLPLSSSLFANLARIRFGSGTIGEDVQKLVLAQLSYYALVVLSLCPDCHVALPDRNLSARNILPKVPTKLHTDEWTGLWL